jgi:isoquinoline 1-oxidoreductase alpha subunit
MIRAEAIEINDEQVTLPEEFREVRLLDFLREHLGLRGTKYGCGLGLCGACTIHLDGAAIRSCQVPASAVLGRRVTTIEGLAGSRTDGRLHPVQEAWIALAVPQCGYCQPGQIMTAAALLADNPDPPDAEVRGALSGNLCRCGTYPRIRRAIRHAAEETRRG